MTIDHTATNRVWLLNVNGTISYVCIDYLMQVDSKHCNQPNKPSERTKDVYKMTKPIRPHEIRQHQKQNKNSNQPINPKYKLQIGHRLPNERDFKFAYCILIMLFASCGLLTKQYKISRAILD